MHIKALASCALVNVLVNSACGGVDLHVTRQPMERIRSFDHPFPTVWDCTERVMRGKQGFPVVIDRSSGLLRFVLIDGTSITAFVESVEPNLTKVYVSRNRGARTPVSESALLDEISAQIRP